MSRSSQKSRADAPAGSECIRRLASLDFTNHEQEIISQVRAGNVPDFLRRFCPVTVTNVNAGKTNSVTFFVAPHGEAGQMGGAGAPVSDPARTEQCFATRRVGDRRSNSSLSLCALRSTATPQIKLSPKPRSFVTL